MGGGGGGGGGGGTVHCFRLEWVIQSIEFELNIFWFEKGTVLGKPT